jgi:hypothetical protein
VNEFPRIPASDCRDNTAPESRFTVTKRPELNSGALSDFPETNRGVVESLVAEAARNLASCGAVSTAASGLRS